MAGGAGACNLLRPALTLSESSVPYCSLWSREFLSWWRVCVRTSMISM